MPVFYIILIPYFIVVLTLPSIPFKAVELYGVLRTQGPCQNHHIVPKGIGYDQVLEFGSRIRRKKNERGKVQYQHQEGRSGITELKEDGARKEEEEEKYVTSTTMVLTLISIIIVMIILKALIERTEAEMKILYMHIHTHIHLIVMVTEEKERVRITLHLDSLTPIPYPFPYPIIVPFSPPST